MILFELHGDPIPQKQTKFARGHCYDPSKKDKEHIQWQARPYAPISPLTGPILLDLTFYFVPPASTSRVRRRQMLNGIMHHLKRPDVDNCAYLITNALKKIFYEDDCQIIDQAIHKRYGEVAKTVVKIVALESIAQVSVDECG